MGVFRQQVCFSVVQFTGIQILVRTKHKGSLLPNKLWFNPFNV